MGYEIEIKAHCDATIKERIDSYCGREGQYVVKEDTYYAFSQDTMPRFRIRRENDGILVSAKVNSRQGGLECNRELEFFHENVSDLDVMKEMAKMLGYEVFIHKYKKGWSWHAHDVHIELLDVKHLGWFLEMEIISQTDGFESNRANYEKLFKVLHDLGLDDKSVETRSYQELLRQFEPRQAAASLTQ